MKALLVAAIVAALAPPAAAHSLDIGYLRIEPAGARSTVVLDLDAAAAAMLLETPSVTAQTLRDRANELAAKTYAREAPVTAAGPCQLGAPLAELAGTTARLSTTLTCPDGAVTWRFPFVRETTISGTFELLVKQTATDTLTVVDRHAPSITIAARRPPAGRIGTTTVLLGGLLIVLVLAPLARFAYRR